MQDKRGRSTTPKPNAESEQFRTPPPPRIPGGAARSPCLSLFLFSISQRIVRSGILLFSHFFAELPYQPVDRVDVIDVGKYRHVTQVEPAHIARLLSRSSSRKHGIFRAEPQRSSRRPLAVDRRNRLQIHRTRFPLPSFLHGHHAPIRNRIVRPPLQPRVIQELAPNHVLSDNDKRDSPNRHEQRRHAASRALAPVAQCTCFPENSK